MIWGFISNHDSLRHNQIKVRHLFCGIALLAGSFARAQNIPHELVGKWVIQRELPTRTISCWGNKEATAIIGSEIEYTADSFRWKRVITRHPKVEVHVISAEQFENENSSPSANGSQVSFHQLGINLPETKEVNIEHPAAQITKATSEIPGDLLLVKDHNTIVFSVCNIYFEAKRLRPRVQ